MSSVWKTRTNIGRVVYDRKKHYFKASDVRRVARASIENLASGILYDNEEAEEEAHRLMEVCVQIFTEIHFSRTIDIETQITYILNMFQALGITAIGYLPGSVQNPEEETDGEKQE